MATRLKGRDLLCLKDFSKEEVLEIISFGDKLKWTPWQASMSTTWKASPLR